MEYGQYPASTDESFFSILRMPCGCISKIKFVFINLQGFVIFLLDFNG